MKNMYSTLEELMKVKLEIKDDIIELHKVQIEIIKIIQDMQNRIEKMENKNG
tara:strand:- start:3536 stop:3691 length:156 start_codon:yes stop_codon:yes gene_type:complete